jgi:hypothetical protein
MGHPTKIQLIQLQTSKQWYVNFPAALAQVMEFDKGEVWEWIVEDKNQLVLKRQIPVESALKKNSPSALPREIWDRTETDFRTTLRAHAVRFSPAAQLRASQDTCALGVSLSWTPYGGGHAHNFRPAVPGLVGKLSRF